MAVVPDYNSGVVVDVAYELRPRIVEYATISWGKETSLSSVTSALVFERVHKVSGECFRVLVLRHLQPHSSAVGKLHLGHLEGQKRISNNSLRSFWRNTNKRKSGFFNGPKW